MQGNEEHSANQHQRTKDPRAIGVPAQQVVQRAQVDHEHDRIDDGQACDHDQPRFVGVKTVRDLRRRVVLAQFDSNGDDDLGHQRD